MKTTVEFWRNVFAQGCTCKTVDCAGSGCDYYAAHYPRNYLPSAEQEPALKALEEYEAFLQSLEPEEYTPKSGYRYDETAHFRCM